MSDYNINLHEALYSLSDALDLVGVTHIHHGKRVAYIAAECGKRMGWAGQRLDDLFQAAILHDCGVSKTIIHSRLAQLEWEYENEHCQAGAELVQRCPLLVKLTEVIRHHHSHWSVLKDMDLPEAIKMHANCIYLADRVDILTLATLKDNSNVLLGIEATCQQIRYKRGDWFHPDLVDIFLDMARSEAFWFRLENDQVSSYAATWVANEAGGSISFADLRSLVHVFSVIVDAKSRFTRQHSEAVARLCRFIGERLGLPVRNCELLELAGLLHDVGKLRIPDEYLEKPGRLTEEEFMVVRRHSFDTYSILKNIRGLEDVALWASLHHERGDGSGYPYHMHIRGLEDVALWASLHHERGDGSGYPYHMRWNGLSTEARIIAVADMFQALEQHRPYRGPVPPEEAIAIIKDEAARDKLDPDIVAFVEANLAECWRIASSDD